MTAPVWFYRDIYPGDEGDDVLIVQRKLAAPMTGVLDRTTENRIRGFQKKHRLEETGYVSKDTAEALGEKESKGQVPDWFDGPLDIGASGPAVAEVRRALRQANKPVHYDDALADAVRRFQAANGLRVTGRVSKSTAVALADRTA